VTESKDKESTTMPRLNAVDPARATGQAKDLLAAVKAQLGLTPNMMRTMATSPAVLEGYLSLGTALAGGSLPARLREQIALAVAEANGCDYCLSAHTALGRLAGLKDDEIARSREGASIDPKSEAVLRFAVAVVAGKGNVSDEEFAQVRGAGFSDGEIAEILAHVAINTFTNYFNKAAGTAIDFPRVEAARKSA
jgi:uncharacterized peroxidase-related enzyme